LSIASGCIRSRKVAPDSRLAVVSDPAAAMRDALACRRAVLRF
jgi:hypothetical protein